jgi:hypothetical protein
MKELLVGRGTSEKLIPSEQSPGEISVYTKIQWEKLFVLLILCSIVGFQRMNGEVEFFP